MWRGFVKRRQTTHALAVRVAETGITGVKLPQVRSLGAAACSCAVLVHEAHTFKSAKAAPS